MEIMEHVTEKHEKDIDFIFKHLGVLKCEQEQRKS
jgi:hypothetical protein